MAVTALEDTRGWRIVNILFFRARVGDDDGIISFISYGLSSNDFDGSSSISWRLGNRVFGSSS